MRSLSVLVVLCLGAVARWIAAPAPPLPVTPLTETVRGAAFQFMGLPVLGVSFTKAKPRVRSGVIPRWTAVRVIT